jgi:small redox-active disulfide protein 2
MIIQVLGVRCAKCKRLYEIAAQAVRETGVEAVVERIEDVQRIMAYEVLMTPALAVDGHVKVVGRVPSLEEVKRLIEGVRGQGPEAGTVPRPGQ